MLSAFTTQYLPGLLATGLYLASTALLLHAITGTQSHPMTANGPNTGLDTGGLNTGRGRIVWGLAMIAALLHALALVYSSFKADGLNLSFFNSLSVTSWFTVILLLLISMGRPVITLGLIVFPISALVLGLSLKFAGQQALAIEPQIQWHVLISVIAYALLTMAAGQSVLVSMQNNRLRSHRPGGFLQALPSLKLMEQVLSQLLIASFIMLLLALITGFIFLDDLFAQRLVHKTTLSILALVLLAILLIGHYRFGWRGQKAARMTLGAYIALLLGYFGSKFVKELVLA